MTILEIGIFRKKLLILHKSFYPLTLADHSLNYSKRSNIIQIIQDMSKTVLNGQLHCVDNKNYRIFFFVKEDLFQDEMFVYAIDDKKSSQKIVQKLLKEIMKKFHEAYPEPYKPNIDEISRYQQFTPIIEETLSDERYLPQDRIKNYIF